MEIKSFARVPIVALTASVMTDDFERAKSNDFDGYLRKPVLKADLTAELCKFLRFQEVTVAEKTPPPLTLAAAELDCLTQALEELKKISGQCLIIAKNNNITEIKQFAGTVAGITHQYPVSAVDNYAAQLESEIDRFDIAAIKRSLHGYPDLIQQLEQLAQPKVTKI